MKLPIPYHKQKTDYTCGPACMQMALQYFDIKTSETGLAKMMKTNSDIGTHHDGMIRAARRHGCYCYVNENSTIHELKHFVELRLPVIINFLEPVGNEAHYSIVKGFDHRGLILNDPYNGRNFHITKRIFLWRWHNIWSKHASKHWMLVLNNQDFQLGKQYKPIKKT